jgi:hypothetical protein
MDSKMVVAKKYQLLSINGEFSAEHKTVVRERAIVERKFANSFNETSNQSGKMYVIDEDATKEWVKEFESNKAASKESAEIEKGANDFIKEVIKERVSKKPNK